MADNIVLRVHLVRHGKVASHHGDIPLTDEGQQQAEQFGQQFANKLAADEIISIRYAPTRRTYETASTIHRVLASTTTHQQNRLLQPVSVEPAIRNPDIYIAGSRVDMVSSVEALAEQLPPDTLTLDEMAHLPFMRDFWAHTDPIGYWTNHADPPGEDADTVARRLFTFAHSFLDLPPGPPRRYICITHSPVMRAFIRRYLLDHDPGEPRYLDSIDLSFTSNHTLIIHYRDYTNIIEAGRQ